MIYICRHKEKTTIPDIHIIIMPLLQNKPWTCNIYSYVACLRTFLSTPLLALPTLRADEKSQILKALLRDKNNQNEHLVNQAGEGS